MIQERKEYSQCKEIDLYKIKLPLIHFAINKTPKKNKKNSVSRVGIELGIPGSYSTFLTYPIKQMPSSPIIRASIFITSP